MGLATVADWSAALTAFRDARLDVDHIWFFVQTHYRPWKTREEEKMEKRRVERGGGGGGGGGEVGEKKREWEES